MVSHHQKAIQGSNGRRAKEKVFEDIIAKRKTSVYRPGKRSQDWLKIKSRPQQEFVVCGFTEGKGAGANIPAPYCLVHTTMDDCAISGTREAASAKGNSKRQSSD
jgi:hypothetical protein